MSGKKRTSKSKSDFAGPVLNIFQLKIPFIKDIYLIHMPRIVWLQLKLYSNNFTVKLSEYNLELYFSNLLQNM